MEIPHKWPGKKKLHTIFAMMRVLGMPEYRSTVKTTEGYYVLTPYNTLSTQQQKGRWPYFRAFVMAYLIVNSSKE
jgi:hypothetical protein